jgi:hypothetical protein
MAGDVVHQSRAIAKAGGVRQARARCLTEFFVCLPRQFSATPSAAPVAEQGTLSTKNAATESFETGNFEPFVSGPVRETTAYAARMRAVLEYLNLRPVDLDRRLTVSEDTYILRHVCLLPECSWPRVSSSGLPTLAADSSAAFIDRRDRNSPPFPDLATR